MMRDNDVEFGQLGMDWITDATPVTGDWVAITSIGAVDAVFTVLTPTSRCRVNGANANLNGRTLPVGRTIYGRFSTITLSAGAVVAYKASLKT
jgi:hypothetical protein